MPQRVAFSADQRHCRNYGDISAIRAPREELECLTTNADAQPIRVCDRCMAEVTRRLNNSREVANRPIVHRHEDLAKKLQAGSGGGLLLGNFEVNQLNRPQDRLLDWFFHPVLVLKEQIQVLKMIEEEVRFLEKLNIFVSNATTSTGRWDNGAYIFTVPIGGMLPRWHLLRERASIHGSINQV